MNNRYNIKAVTYIEMFLLFCAQSVIALIIFFLLNFNGKYADGNVGMAPFQEMFILIIQFLISIVVYFSTRKLINAKYHYAYIILNMVIVALLISFSEGNLLTEIMEDNLNGFFLRCSLLAQLVSTILVLIVYWVMRIKCHI